jgi:tetratricopeptide (TPR) repeat protein
MYAFALEENGQYRRAEKIARRALALDPGHPGAIHVIAHVMEMQGRFQDGLVFLAANESAWGEGTRLALCAVPFGCERSQVRNRRLRCADCDCRQLKHVRSRRWFGIALEAFNCKASRSVNAGGCSADRWASHNLAEARPFYAVHAMMAFAAAGRIAAALRLIETLPRTASDEASSLIPEEAVAPLLCEALLAFVRSEYANPSNGSGRYEASRIAVAAVWPNAT